MGNPKVIISLGNGNLGILATGDTGIKGLIAAIPAANTSGYGTPVLLQTKLQAAAELADASNAGILSAIVDYFFEEAPEGTKLYCLFVANTVTLTNLTIKTNTYFATLENFAGKKLRECGFVKYPDVSYTPTITTGFDAEVFTAATNAQALAVQQDGLVKPVICYIQGYGATTASAAKDYVADTKNGVGIVVGAVNNDTAIPVLLLLARRAKTPVHRNPGRIKDGSLAIKDTDTVKVGSTLISAISDTDLDTYHDKRYITFKVNEDAPGYVFNDDTLLTKPTDDYNCITNRAVINEAQRIAYATCYRELKDEVQVDDGGRMDGVAESNLEATITDAISKNLAGSFSAVSTLVNPDATQYTAWYASASITPNFNLLSGGNVYVFINIRPLGYNKNIMVLLSFTTN